MSTAAKKRRAALGDDALDALFSPSAEKTQAASGAEATPPTKNDAGPQESRGSRDGKTESGSQSAKRPQAEKRKKRGRPRGVGYGTKKSTRWTRSDGSQMRARSIHIPVDLDAKLRRRAAEEDKPIGQVIVEVLEASLS